MTDDLELMEYVYQNAEMGVTTLNELLKELKDKGNKIKKLVEEEVKEYEKFYNESRKLINKTKVPAQHNNLMKKVMASMGVRKEVKCDNSDAAIARMLVEGVTMGIVDISTKIKNYSDSVDNKILDFSKRYLKYQEGEIEKMKKFL